MDIDQSLSPNQMIQKMINDQDFHNEHKNKVLTWSRGVISNNLKKGFHSQIPYEKLNKWVSLQLPQIKACFKQADIKGIQMVGSSSIPGMCGMFSQDFGIFVDNFPPTDETINNLQKIGYKLTGFYNLQQTYDDLWFFKQFHVWNQQDMVVGASIHIWKQGSKNADKMISFRDLAIKDKKVFEDYRNKKLQMMSNESVNVDEYITYKIEKGKIAAKSLFQSKQSQQ